MMAEWILALITRVLQDLRVVLMPPPRRLNSENKREKLHMWKNPSSAAALRLPDARNAVT